MSRDQALYVLKLRRNISLEGDLALARLELEALTGGVSRDIQDVEDLAALGQRAPALLAAQHLAALGAFCRAGGQQGYALRGPLSLLPTLIRRASFLQAIYCVPTEAGAGAGAAAGLVERLAIEVGPVVRLLAGDAGDTGPLLYAVPHYLLLELSAVVARGARSGPDTRERLAALLAALLDDRGDSHALRTAEAALLARSTTSQLAHDLHYYKAKFFPRMARSLLNICAERGGGPSHRVLDTFAGSGTALLESSLLGMPSVGTDLDPLSVLIARAKLDTFHISSAALAAEAARFPRGRIPAPALRPRGTAEAAVSDGTGALIFPQWLLRNRKMTVSLAAELADEIVATRAAVESATPELRPLLRVLLSDAIARKVRLRFLGTGVGRFSLNVRKTPLAQTISDALRRYALAAASREWLEETLRLRPAEAQVVVADARRTELDASSFDVLVTSPPYLPASSGRESYTKGRALSLIALGLRDHESVDDLVDDAVGSMDGADADTAELTPEQAALVAWLRDDELRAIKAAPTTRYFLDMRRAFAEMRRVLAPGAHAAVVSGKVSTFYQFATRDPLYVVPVAEMLAADAERAGLVVEGLHDIQLHKANRNARPRSLDAYYETLIMLRRPD